MAKFQQKRPKVLLKAYGNNHLLALIASWKKLIHESLLSFFTVIIIAVALTIPVSFYITIKSVQQLTKQWERKSSQISLYLKVGLSQTVIQSVLQKLQDDSRISNVQYISPEAGLQEFANTIGAKEATSILKANPIPALIIIEPQEEMSTSLTIKDLLQELHNFPETEAIQLDMKWLQRLDNIILLAKRLTYMLALLLGISAILIIGNTVNSATQTEQQEIAILKQIGATNAFIRRPFLYIGAWYGMFGGILTSILVNIMMWWLQIPISVLNNLYHANFTLTGLGFKGWLLLIIFSSLLGAVGAFFATLIPTKSLP